LPLTFVVHLSSLLNDVLLSTPLNCQLNPLSIQTEYSSRSSDFLSQNESGREREQESGREREQESERLLTELTLYLSLFV